MSLLPASAPYTNDFIKSMYGHYLTMYQQRYLSETAAYPVTWQTVAHWRAKVTMYGRWLIGRGLLDYLQFMEDKHFFFRRPDGLLKTQKRVL